MQTCTAYIPKQHLHAQVMAFGNNAHGELGISAEKRNVCRKPTRTQLPSDATARLIACGGLHSIVVGDVQGTRKVYGFGADGGGQLGLSRRGGSEVSLRTCMYTLDSILGAYQMLVCCLPAMVIHMAFVGLCK